MLKAKPDGVKYTLTEEDIVELIHFLWKEYIDREEHDAVHKLLFELNAKLDEAYGHWDLNDMLKKVRGF